MKEKGFAHLILLLVLVGLGIVGVVYLSKARKIVTTPDFPYSSPTPTLTDEQKENFPRPEYGKLYYTSDRFGPGIFYTNEGIQNAPGYLSKWKGEFWGFNEPIAMRGYGDEPRSEDAYFDLLGPSKEIATINIDSIYQGIKAKGSVIEYLMLWERFGTETEFDTVQKIYQLHMKDLTLKEIWVNTKFISRGELGIPWMDEVIEDKYLRVGIYTCRDCEGEENGKLIINIQTGKEKYLESVGDLTFNTKDNMVTYQKLHPFEESCDWEGMRCENGKMTIMKPSGQTYTESLP